MRHPPGVGCFIRVLVTHQRLSSLCIQLFSRIRSPLPRQICLSCLGGLFLFCKECFDIYFGMKLSRRFFLSTQLFLFVNLSLNNEQRGPHFVILWTYFLGCQTLADGGALPPRTEMCTRELAPRDLAIPICHGHARTRVYFFSRAPESNKDCFYEDYPLFFRRRRYLASQALRPLIISANFLSFLLVERQFSSPPSF